VNYALNAFNVRTCTTASNSFNKFALLEKRGILGWSIMLQKKLFRVYLTTPIVNWAFVQIILCFLGCKNSQPWTKVEI